MVGGLADIVITDPPYGVAYVGKTKDALTVENDDVDEETLALMCKDWFDRADEVSRPGAYWIATVPAGPLHGVFFNDWKRRGYLRQVMVWNKDSMVLGHSEYHYKHEPILFGWKPGDRLRNNDRTKTTVWDFPRPKASREHPTMKPVEMWVYGITNHSRPGDLVYEPFSGSGTTIIACERTGRKCRAIELNPAYVAVAIQRWADATGKEPRKL
jgi:site-specific DNA-methyltransferase (adenine-specific)